jgi:hypothetical protein
MDLFLRMPLKLSKIAKFFHKISDNILRDFNEIISISRKDRFGNKTIERFNMECEKFEEFEIDIFLDGEDNFKKGINLFTLCAIDDDKILIYDIFTTIFSWGTCDEFFINGIRCKSDFGNSSSRIIEKNSIIPDSLRISWFLSGAINGFYCNNEKFLNVVRFMYKENETDQPDEDDFLYFGR